jgi:FtsZ-binding cell division protein ZapB
MSNNKISSIFAVFGLILGLIIGVGYYRPKVLNYQSEISDLSNIMSVQDDTIVDLQFEIEDLDTELSQISNEYDGLAHEYRELESTSENLLYEKEEYEEKYNNVLNQYSDILSSYSPPYNIMNQNYDYFTEYRQIDPDDSIFISTNRVNWINMNRSIGRNIWRDYEASFSSDFIHKFTFSIEQIEAGDRNNREIVRLWTLKKYDVSLILYAEQAGTIDDKYNLVFFQRDRIGNLFEFYSSDYFDSLSVGEVYYVTISKQGDVYRLFVNDNVITLIDSGPHLGISEEYTTLSIVSIGGYSEDLEDWSSGFVENLRIFN